jgi:TolB-like protein/DNA-binding SARP family transcriptional activator/Tfp pilus assembly protein PilF
MIHGTGEAAQERSWRIRLFGGLRVEAAGVPLAGRAGQKKRVALLALLAGAPGRSLTRDKLVGYLWPESDTEGARHLLASTLYELRRAIAEDVVLAVPGDELRLNAGRIGCDLWEFGEALERNARDRAVALYAGPFLDGFFLSDAPEFERWAESERDRLARHYANALEALVAQAEAVGDTGAVAEWCRRLAAHDLYSSRVALRLMRALAAAGDPAGAIQHARAHERLLHAELGIAPDPQVSALAEELRSDRLMGHVSHPAPGKRTLSAEAADSTAVPVAVPITPPAPAGELVSSPEASRQPGRWRPVLVGVSTVLFGAILVLGIGSATSRADRYRGSGVTIRSIAVLPLENLSSDPEQEFFTDGMTDALITELARFPRLRVISRTSMLQYRGAQKPLPEIVRELGVDAVVEGTVLREGGRVRITAQLIHAATNRHLWAERYERDLTDILFLQSDVAEAIAQEIHLVAAPGDRPARRSLRPVDPVAHELYLRGRYAALARTRAGLEEALRHYHQAIARDSAFALAYAGLADTHKLLGGHDFRPLGPAVDTARVLAERALALDPALSEAHNSMAGVLTDLGEWQPAEEAFRRAIALQPGNVLAHHWFALLLATLGRGDEALAEIRRAQDLDPFAPALRNAHVMILDYVGDREGATRHLEETLPLFPTHAPTYERLATHHAMAGRCAEALAVVRKATELGLKGLMLGAVAFARCDVPARADAVLKQLRARGGAAKSLSAAGIHGARGEVDSAFAALDLAEWNMSRRVNVLGNPSFDSLRSDPRYSLLLRRMGLER